MDKRTVSVTDTVMYLASRGVGRAEIDEYLRISGQHPGKKVLNGILKRIRHPGLYREDGKLRTYAKSLAAGMIVLLILFFVLTGTGAYKLAKTVSQNPAMLIPHTEKDEMHILTGITDFRQPHIQNAEVQVLIRSSQTYNVRYTIDGRTVYYTQTPKSTAQLQSGKETTLPDGLFADINGNPATVSRTYTGDVNEFEIKWSDENHFYRINGACSMEEAVRFAKSVYYDVERNQ